MIVKLFVTLLAKVALWVLALCSLVGIGGWAAKLAEGASALAPMTAKLYNLLFDMGAWVPGETLAMGLLAAVSIVFTGFCIKVGRMLLSLFTGGGGSAS